VLISEVNYWLIGCALGALEEEESRLGDLEIDPDDARLMRELFSRIVAPRVRNWREIWREKLRVTLAYYIRRRIALDYETFGGLLQDLTMPEPSDMAAFLSLLSDVLFEGQSWEEVRLEGVVENNDVMEINKLYAVDA
jgi:hypothetical protein